MDGPKPLLSVVTPSFNQSHFIRATIDSVAAQDYPHIEHIVMDGGSTDRTREVLAEYPKLTWTSEPDKGQTDAINKGLRRATGEIVAYINSDDVYRQGAFSAAAGALAAHPEAVAVVGDCDVIDAQGETVGFLKARLDDPEDLLRFWEWDRKVCIPQAATFIRRSALDAVGLFDESFDMAMDLEMWLRLARFGPIITLDTTLAAYRDTDENKTSTRRYDMLAESYRAAVKHLEIAPPERRDAVEKELRRELAGHLLTIAEDGPSGRKSARAMGIEALKVWPWIAHSPRLWRVIL